MEAFELGLVSDWIDWEFLMQTSEVIAKNVIENFVGDTQNPCSWLVYQLNGPTALPQGDDESSTETNFASFRM